MKQLRLDVVHIVAEFKALIIIEIKAETQAIAGIRYYKLQSLMSTKHQPSMNMVWIISLHRGDFATSYPERLHFAHTLRNAT